MSNPTEKPRNNHASMPRFVAWVQDNLLLTLLIIASGFVNGVMMIDGWVTNVQDPNSWGVWGTFGVIILFAAGLGMGGLALRISYKLSECYANRQWGRVFFMALGMLVFAFIEFWASFSQRVAHIHITPADNALLGALNIHNPGVSLTAILISIVVPFASIFWGFAAEDPAPKPVEDPEVLRQKLENERVIAEHKADMMTIRAKGIRKAVAGVRGKELPAEAPANTEVSSSQDGINAEGESEEKLPDSPVKLRTLPRGLMDKEALIVWAKKELNRDLTDEQAVDVVKNAKGMMRLDGSHGRPYVAPKRSVTALAKRMYPPVPVRAITPQRSQQTDDNPESEAMQ